MRERVLRPRDRALSSVPSPHPGKHCKQASSTSSLPRSAGQGEERVCRGLASQPVDGKRQTTTEALEP